MSSITITTGTQSGTHFELANRPLSVGRDPSRDIQIVDPKVSRKHAMIRREGDSYVISASKALNGIMINSEEVSGDTVLREGDLIVLGDTVLRFGEPASDNETNAVNKRKIADRQARDANTMM